MSSIKELKADKIKFKNDYIKYVEITNLLGHKYRESGHYNEGVKEHMEAITICKKIKNQTINRELEAVSRRALGECYSEMSKHVEALNQQELYLRLAFQINDPIEIQRAHATIGRTYLLWGQESSSDDKTNYDLVKKAEASFQKALDLCENLRSSGKLKPREYAEMKSRLLLNLGLVYENLHDFGKCKILIEESIALTKANFLLDELFRCQISMGSIYEKTDSFKEAIYHYEEALKTATSLKSKRKKFDVFICLGLVWMKKEDVNRSKSYFKRAYFLNIPIKEDKERIIHFLKVTLAIIDDLQKLSETNDLEDKIILCDKLGDHFVVIKCYLQAIKYYKKELLFATEANKPDDFISKIYVSIGQTYFDDGKYQEAIEYFKHEYNFQLGNTCEQCTSLLKIADIQESLFIITDNLESEEKDKLKNEIIKNYETTIRLLLDRKTLIQEFSGPNNEHKMIDSYDREKLKLYKIIIRNYLNFLNTNNINQFRQKELKDDLLSLSNWAIIDEETEKYDDPEPEILVDIYDKYDLDLLSSDSDSVAGEDDEETPENFHSRPKRNLSKSFRNRLNQFGETPLHTACISGNLAQVERLLEQNVDINAKDFCGWTPLHEACNHGHLPIVEYLLKKGANIEAHDDRSDRITPLHDACNCGHLEIIRTLLNYNANVLAVNSNNETPLECLMSWRERCKMELNEQEVDDCAELEILMMNLMKDKGFDTSNLFKQNKPQQTVTTNCTITNTNTNIKKRNLVKDLIYSSENSNQFICDRLKKSSISDYDDSAHKAREEYMNTIEFIRYFGSRSKSLCKSITNEKQRQQQQPALVNEGEETPRDDWLIDDLEDNKKMYIRKRNHESFNGYDVDSNKKLKPNDQKNRVINLDLPEKNNNNNNPIDYSEDNRIETLFEHCLPSPIEIVHSNQNKILSAAKLNSTIRNTANNSSNNRKALTINFDDSHKSSFIVFIENESNCKWLREELTRRYFTHYGMKPLFSLKTDNDAILLDSDLVIDIIGDNERTIKAVIDSWTVDQPDKRYVELCMLQQIDIDRNIESCLRKSYKSFYLTFHGLFFPSKTHITLMFKSLLQQTIKELDLSNTNLLINKENYNAFRTMVTSLPNLEELYLSGVSFPSNCLIHLINLNLSLKKLDLSFNSLGDESTYSLAQIIITFRKLEYFNLSACDLTERFAQSNLLVNSIKNSSLVTLLLDHNDFPEDLIDKFKSMDDINRA